MMVPVPRYRQAVGGRLTKGKRDQGLVGEAARAARIEATISKTKAILNV
jgi:hypothetical protein